MAPYMDHPVREVTAAVVWLGAWKYKNKAGRPRARALRETRLSALGPLAASGTGKGTRHRPRMGR